MATLEEMRARRKTHATYGKKYGDRSIADTKYEAHRPKTNRVKEFIAWDGEGIDDEYVLFMNSKGDKIVNMNGLSTDECLLFLCSIKERYPNAINVVYGGSYDANMILRDLPFKHLQILQKNHHVYYKYFRIEFIPRKYFRVSQYDHRVYGDKRKRKPLCSVTLWDVIGFFQGSFLKSLEEYFKNVNMLTELHMDEIKEGKERRNTFSEDELHQFIIPYCGYEVQALVHLMNKLRENLLVADIHVTRWDGAGAAAAAILKQYGVKKHYQTIPRQIEEILQVSYGGGRVEMFMYGHHDSLLYHYDIIGAYPSVMPDLPSLIGGKWIHHPSPMENVHMLTELDIDNFTVYKIYWDYREGNSPLYPFFYRQPWGQARIFYSDHGYSWVMGPEVKKAIKWKKKLGGELHILERWQFIAGNDEKPFAFVEELYKLRMKYKAEGNGAQLALKLALNALYGKMAQTVGYASNEKNGEPGKLPPFYNLFFASYITSKTRSKMFDAMMQAPKSIIACATDGLWSLQPLQLNICKKGEEKLGEWESEELHSFTSVQAGVYFCRNAKGEDLFHYRGFNQGSIMELSILDVWRMGGYTYKAKTRRFCTLGTSLASFDRWRDVWRKWIESFRKLEVFPSSNQKREAYHPTPDAAYRLVATYATPVIRLDEEVQNVHMLTETFLSRKHPLPWEHVELTEEQEERRRKEEELWEIIESDVETNAEIDIEKQREGEF